MSVEREVVIQIGTAEMNDECGVDVDFMGARDALTVAEARAFAEEILQAAAEAEAATVEAVAREVKPSAFDVDGPRTMFADDVERDLRVLAEAANMIVDPSVRIVDLYDQRDRTHIAKRATTFRGRDEAVCASVIRLRVAGVIL